MNADQPITLTYDISGFVSSKPYWVISGKLNFIQIEY